MIFQHNQRCKKIHVIVLGDSGVVSTVIYDAVIWRMHEEVMDVVRYGDNIPAMMLLVKNIVVYSNNPAAPILHYYLNPAIIPADKKTLYELENDQKSYDRSAK